MAKLSEEQRHQQLIEALNGLAEAIGDNTRMLESNGMKQAQELKLIRQTLSGIDDTIANRESAE